MANLDAKYFSDHPDKLLDLKEWLTDHRQLNLRDRMICRLIREEGLGLTSKRNERQDLSIGEFLQQAGGIEEFLRTPAYKLSLAVACVGFAKQYIDI